MEIHGSFCSWFTKEWRTIQPFILPFTVTIYMVNDSTSVWLWFFFAPFSYSTAYACNITVFCLQICSFTQYVSQCKEESYNLIKAGYDIVKKKRRRILDAISNYTITTSKAFFTSRGESITIIIKSYNWCVYIYNVLYGYGCEGIN